MRRHPPPRTDSIFPKLAAGSDDASVARISRYWAGIRPAARACLLPPSDDGEPSGPKFELLAPLLLGIDAAADRRGAKILLPEPIDLASAKDMDAATTRNVVTATAAAEGGDTRGRALMVGASRTST